MINGSILTWNLYGQWTSSTGQTAVTKFKPRLPAGLKNFCNYILSVPKLPPVTFIIAQNYCFLCKNWKRLTYNIYCMYFIANIVPQPVSTQRSPSLTIHHFCLQELFLHYHLSCPRFILVIHLIKWSTFHIFLYSPIMRCTMLIVNPLWPGAPFNK